MSRISYTWSLMGASWGVLKKDREILVFPFIAGICTLLISASFLIPFYTSGNWMPPDSDASFQQQLNYYLILFAFYFCNYFILIFFNSAVVACAEIRMRGGDPTVRDGIQVAVARLPLILGWALLSASVGLILRIIEDRISSVGKLIVGVLGMAWSVVSFLVIPILVIEKKGPVTAFKESTMLLKKTWGEQLIGTFSFGLIFFLLAIPAALLIAVGAATGSAGMIFFIVLAVVYILILASIQSALQTIFQAAVYLYAREGRVPDGFQSEQLAGSMAQR